MTTQEDVDDLPLIDLRQNDKMYDLVCVRKEEWNRIEARLRAAEDVISASKAFLSHYAGPEWNGELIEDINDAVNEWEKLK